MRMHLTHGRVLRLTAGLHRRIGGGGIVHEQHIRVKGRISNELVAASCAAILAVYSAGYWRTREEARRQEAEGQSRRPVRPTAPEQDSTPTVSTSAMVAPAGSLPMAGVHPVGSKPQQEAMLPEAGILQPLPAPAVSPQISAPAAPAVAADGNPVPDAAPEAASAVASEVVEPAAPLHKPWLDGYYTGWGQSRHGDIQAFVTIEGGRIVNSGIAICETRYPCSVIEHILLQPVELQGPDVDAVSRATESADAYYTGLVRALENAETGVFRSSRP